MSEVDIKDWIKDVSAGEIKRLDVRIDCLDEKLSQRMDYTDKALELAVRVGQSNVSLWLGIFSMIMAGASLVLGFLK